MADIKWIKLSVNMFDDEKIKLIRTMPEGDKIIVIWVQMLCLAGRTNASGSVYMGQNLYYTDEMLAAICGQPLNIMRLALHTLEQFGMIEKTENGLIDIVNWEKHQNTEGMEKIRKQTAERQQLHYYRKKIKALSENVDEDDLPTDVEGLKEYHRKLTLGLTLPNATELDKDKEKELDKDKEKELEKQEPLVGHPDNTPYKEIVEYLNQKTGKQYRVGTPATQRVIKARFKEGFTLDDFKKVIDNKTADWLKDTKMSEYLRPQTLFGAEKFEGYLNQKSKVKQAPADDRYDLKHLVGREIDERNTGDVAAAFDENEYDDFI